ncbi:ParH-like protein [Streptomyces sp. NPDC052040]|uniref:ParH-like protein n=1 Tax=Streptomyces sp. NPDC052040 TaxID=3365682 RepID=UPI0037CEF217
MFDISRLSRWWSDRRRFRRLHRTAEELLDRLDLPTGSGISTLIDQQSRRRDRLIHVMPMVLGADEPCGIWLATDTVDIIVVEADTTPFHQDHIIAHELAHMLCAHSDPLKPEPESMALLFPHLDVQRVIEILGRTAYSTEDEQAAEMVGSLILERVTRPPMEFTWAVPSGDAATVARIAQSLRPTE